VTVLRPGSDLPSHVAALDPDRVLVNLAAPGAFEAMLALRLSGCMLPFWGCLLAPGASAGLALRLVEPMERSFDPDRVLSRVAPSCGRRVLTAGADGDRLIALRQRLAAAGMSVSIAWDGKQAATLLDMITPDVALIDLDLPPRGGHRIVARLAGVDAPRILVLVSAPGDASTRFAAALADHLRGAAGLTRDRLLAEAMRHRAPVVQDVPVPRK
jgi:CheY-like chemotaxis protein